MTYNELGIDISKIRGKSGKTTCPKCSASRKKKTDPCLSVDLTQGLYNCHNCGWAGVLFKSQVREVYVKPEAFNQTALSEKLVNWFKGRGISQATLQEFKIGESLEHMPQTQKQENCILFPYYRDNELVNIKYRDGAKNFKLSKGAELIFFNLNSLINAPYAIICEGEVDCLTFHQSGLKHVVSVPNGASKNQRLEYLDNCIDYFDGIEKIYLATDDDEPGRSLREELARRLGHDRCFKVTYFGNKDVNELYVKEPLKVDELLLNAESYPLEGIFTSTDIVEEIYDLQTNGLQPGAGISIPQFNQLITFEKGYVNLITGIPGHGKSEFADQLMVDLNTMHGYKWAMFSPENYPLKLHFSKTASKITGKHFNQIGKEELDEVINYFSKNFYFIMPPEDLSLDNILEKVRLSVKRYGVNGFIIDAWNKLEHQYAENESKYISQSLDKIDTFCRKYNLICLLVAHPKKIERDKNTGNFRMPNMYDVSGSSTWYDKPANGIVVYRNFETGQTEVSVLKVKFKHWGEGGSVTLNYNKVNGRYFYSLSSNDSFLGQKPVEQKIIKFETEVYDGDNPF